MMKKQDSPISFRFPRQFQVMIEEVSTTYSISKSEAAKRLAMLNMANLSGLAFDPLHILAQAFPGTQGFGVAIIYARKSIDDYRKINGYESIKDEVEAIVNLAETSEKPQANSFLGSDRRGIINQPGEVIDVDTQADFDYAEYVLLKRQREAEIEAEGNK